MRDGGRAVSLRVGKFKVLGVAVLSALVLTVNAFAADKPGPYAGAGGNVQQQVQGTEGTGTLGGLPFTGLDLALIVGGGLVLLIAGLSVRRVANRRA
jgi:hypothetical protein